MSKIEYAITSIAYASEASAKNLSAITKDLIGHATEFNSRMDRASEAARGVTNEFLEVRHSAQGLREDIQETRLSIKGMAETLVDNLDNIGKKANELSEMSNRMIQFSGMAGDTVREFRSEIFSIVRELNIDTGSAYSPIKSYESIISMTQGVTSNLEAIEEMARPLLLTQEALDVNINSVATLFNRFYTRYTFSSAHMEDALDNIRGNTAGNAANAEATMRNIDSLKTFIDNTAGDNNDLREELLERVSNYTAWLESMEMDSSKFTEWMKNAAYGDFRDTGLNTVIGYSGRSQTDVADLARSGEYEAVTQAFMDGIYNMLSQFESDGKQGLTFEELGPMAQTLEAMGHDPEFLLDTYNTVISGAYKSLDDFILNQAATPRMEELVEDKFYTMATKSENWLENIYGMLAKIQEYLPFGFSDLAVALLAFRGAFGTFSSGGAGNFLGAARGLGANSAINGAASTLIAANRFPTIGGALNSASGALGNVAAIGGGLGGAAMLAGGGLAGLGLAWDGINGVFNSEDSAGTRILSGVEGAAGLGGAAALVGLGVTNPIGWVSLAIGGAALLGKNLHEAATTIGETAMIEDAYDKAAESIIEKSRENEDVLLSIKSGLEHEEDLNQMMRDLIDSGIMSESDRQKAVKAAQEGNRDALIELTNAYLEATGKFTPDYENALDEYERSDIEYAENLKKSMVSALQEWNDKGKLKEGSEELASADTLFYSIYKGLQEQQSNGVKLDKATQKTYDNLAKIYETGDRKLSTKEANMVIDEGWFNTTLKNSNLGVDTIMSAASKMGAKNQAGADFYNSILPSGTFYGSKEASYVLDLAYKALHATSEESALEYLNKLRDEGYTSSKYKEIGEAASNWGLEGYSDGTNYITRDQIALIHEGEAITPKRYNPMANLNELETLREQSRISQKEMSDEAKKSQSYMRQTFETLNEIKEFLSYWREDAIKRDAAKDTKNRFSASSRFISSYTLEST